jgi:hypothetical protein
MCYASSMEEIVKPEVQVIRNLLQARYPSPGPKYHETDAMDIWAALLDYWTNRGKNMDKDSPQYTEPNSICSVPPFSAPEFEDGSQRIPFKFTEPIPDGATLVLDGEPYIHGGASRTYDFPSTKTAQDDEPTDRLISELNDVIFRYELFIKNRLYVLREDLYEIANLPGLTEKQRKRINKAVKQLDKVDDGED